jgi:hypothetical protein
MSATSKLFSLIALAGAFHAVAEASPLLYLNVQMVQVCNDSGAQYADPSQQNFAALTSQIWAQADIDVNFLPWQQLDSTASYSGGELSTEFDEFSTSPLTPLADIVYTYVLPDDTFRGFFPDCGGCAGLEYLGTPNAQHSLGVLSDIVIGTTDDNSATDYLAHQLGFALGLQSTGFSDAFNLMRSSLSGGANSGSVAAGLDSLTAAQIATARGNAILTSQPIVASPEPAGFFLIAVPVAFLFYRQRRT